MYRSNTNPMFRSKFSEDIFNHKYRHEGAETWETLCSTLVDHVCEGLLSKDEMGQLKQYMTDMKFLPGGRYLYYAGRPNAFFNNCLTADTNILTNVGWRKAHEVGKALVISPVDGNAYWAEFNYHGVQPVYSYKFKPLRGRSKVSYEVKATRNHKWALMNGEATENLQVGQVVPAFHGISRDPDDFDSEEYGQGFAHGFVYGDGNANGQLRLCGSKVENYLELLRPFAKSVTYPPSADGDPCLYFGKHPFYDNTHQGWKELPHEGYSLDFLTGFIEGWLAADGHDDRLLSSVDPEAIHWFRKNAPMVGIVMSGVMRSQTRNVSLGDYQYPDHTIYMQNFSRGADWAGFKVDSITYLGDEEVYCPFEPVHNQIVIDHGIHTYQCYLLRAEEDTREDWANLSWKSESCLMTGGGIGADYSVYRPEGFPIAKTGGLASGPIPKMQMINEIGRRVMQGGSRRSAIYASLNWAHGDAETLLTVKDWDQYPVGTTGFTLADIKQQDFNFPAPLDMTNISLNYDDAWLNLGEQERAVNPTFLKNMRQALRTAEPGFSFNFGDKQNETLRNACTEVTSEDDSDVCNLGSLNMGRIDTLQEFMDITDLATKFLICGTLKADLPYEAVKLTREKNRRLGLGLMGVHEWLIKKGSRYEVTPELRNWLAAYATISDNTSRTYADLLNVSRPVANRAIAPTGSIGILAGTTTGIEPLFAVAYKRRYLKGQNDWRYQYVVDGTAQELIELYGADPDKIESAVDLAADYERRIAFQADVQDFVDMAISSTINLPEWGSEGNNEDTVVAFAHTLSKYAPRLRGFTCYPDGARGGQPLTPIDYRTARDHAGQEFSETTYHDICDISGKGGTCGG